MSASATFALTVNPGSGPSPDGSMISGVSTGGGTGTLRTAYGVWSFGDRAAEEPGWGGGSYNEVLLNGKLVKPGYNFNRAQQLHVNYGGRLFAIVLDQIWYEWSYYYWQTNFGRDFTTPPSHEPVYGGFPNYNPPFAQSAENTSIDGGIGSLQTVDGLWTFGAAHDGGWDPLLNGLPLGAPGDFAVTMMTVYAHGQLFFRLVDGTWYYWAGNQPNFTSGPTAAPIPVSMSFMPSPNPTVVPHNPPIGTFVVTVNVTMSDASAFTGAVSVLGPFGEKDLGAAGMNIVTAVDPWIPVYPARVMATQNGATFENMINPYSS